ncbi:MAG TPA: hypothetical protein VIK65_00615 [Candidatus Limnocylindrales bacterium]|jgi:hypothetical protein
MTNGRRRILVTVALGIAIVGTLVWAVPSFGARLFVDVAARVTPVAGGGVTNRSVVLADGSVASSSRLRIEVAVTNHYPIPVVVEFGGSAIHAELVARDRPGEPPVWRSTGDDPSLESGDDSPDAGTSRVVVVQPGTTTLPSAAAGMILDASSAAAIPAGIYALRVSAFGVDASPALLSIVDGAS